MDICECDYCSMWRGACFFECDWHGEHAHMCVCDTCHVARNEHVRMRTDETERRRREWRVLHGLPAVAIGASIEATLNG